MSKKSRSRRRRYWINPAFQKRFLFMLLTLELLTLALGALMPTYWAFLYVYPVTEVAGDATKILMGFGIVAFVATAALAYFSIRVSHTICGPVYRLEVALKQLKRGERPDPIVLRKGDELRELVQLFNETVEAIHLDAPTVSALIQAIESAEGSASSEIAEQIPLAEKT